MDNNWQPQFFTERRLKGTLLNERPHRGSRYMATLIVMFIGCVSFLYWQPQYGVTEYLIASGEMVFAKGEYWRLFTSVLIHADWGHYLSNMLLMYIFGYFIFGYFGWKYFPLVCYLGAVITNACSLYTYDPKIRLLGASGMVFLMGGYWLTMYFFIQRQYTMGKRIIRVIGIGLMLFFPIGFEPSTSYRTHYIGFSIGLLIALVHFYYAKKQLRAWETYNTEIIEVEA